MCPTYPATLVVPACISDEQLKFLVENLEEEHEEDEDYYIDRETLDARVRELGAKITEDYRGGERESPALLPVRGRS